MRRAADDACAALDDIPQSRDRVIEHKRLQATPAHVPHDDVGSCAYPL